MAKNSQLRKLVGDPMRCNQTSAGYTLIELMVVLAISASLLAIGIPAFYKLILSQRLTTHSNALLMAVKLARSEAIHRGRRVDLVPLDGANWSKGWLVFVDQNHNQRRDPGETLIYSYSIHTSELRITPRFRDSKVQYIAYNGSGRSVSNTGKQLSQSGHWLLELGTDTRKVVINFLGRPRICNPLKDKASC
ncbi:hypothetical protein D3C72_151810 [compost metagenome]